MKLVGTIILWLMSLGAVLVGLGAGFLAYSLASTSPYSATWLLVVPAVAAILAALWINPLVRGALRQRGKPLRLWSGVLLMIGVAVCAVFAQDWALKRDPTYQLSQGEVWRDSDPTRAETAYASACDAGLSEGCYAAGVLTDPITPWGGKAHSTPVQSRAYLQRACEMEHAEACLFLSMSLSEENREEAERLMIHGCDLQPGTGWRDNNDAYAQFCVGAGGTLLDQTSIDIEHVVSLFDKACPESAEDGRYIVPLACKDAGVRLLAFARTQSSDPAAAEWTDHAVGFLQRSCEAEGTPYHRLGCYDYAEAVGLGVVSNGRILLEPDRARGQEILDRACDDGIDRACAFFTDR